MKKMQKLMKALLVGLFAVALMMPAPASALTLTTGTLIIAIDGDSDSNVAVDILSIGGTTSYTYGYFLNGGAIFNAVTPFTPTTFAGGDVLDFALWDGTKYYTLSGDAADGTYSVMMTFANQVTVGSPQQPATWPEPYYYNSNITWTIASTVNTNEFTLNFTNNGNDGIAPVPEPSTLLLLGSGLLGIGLFSRKRKA
ncbi:MAG: hypothetical protein HW415_1498 [Deltaproteobacteria bacterium]|nr:hypothetical protein [Deltaproteobacteria bacterium]